MDINRPFVDDIRLQLELNGNGYLPAAMEVGNREALDLLGNYATQVADKTGDTLKQERMILFVGESSLRHSKNKSGIEFSSNRNMGFIPTKGQLYIVSGLGDTFATKTTINPDEYVFKKTVESGVNWKSTDKKHGKLKLRFGNGSFFLVDQNQDLYAPEHSSLDRSSEANRMRDFRLGLMENAWQIIGSNLGLNMSKLLLNGGVSLDESIFESSLNGGLVRTTSYAGKDLSYVTEVNTTAIPNSTHLRNYFLSRGDIPGIEVEFAGEEQGIKLVENNDSHGKETYSLLERLVRDFGGHI